MKTVAEIFAERGGAPAPHTPVTAWQWAENVARQVAARASATDETRAYRFKPLQKKTAVLLAYPSKRNLKKAKRALAVYVPSPVYLP